MLVTCTCLSLLLLSACTSLRVDSYPRGAEVYIDGEPTGKRTPTAFKPGEIGSGQRTITVRAPGYGEPLPQDVRTGVSAGQVVWTVLMPVPFLFIYAPRGWQATWPPKVHFALPPES